MDWITQHEAIARTGIFASILILMLAAEQIIPERTEKQPRRRQITNLSLTLINTLALRLVPGMTAVAAAALAAQKEWGLFHLIKPGLGASIVFSILVLDAGVYLQHLAFHRFPLLWRIHRVHHCDPQLDATTALRFHPAEILPSSAYKFILVLILGAPLIAVIIFEALLNASAIFNHANIHLPRRLDRILRRLIVTPNMHSSHHSPEPKFTNSNYGFFLSIWDRLFGTYSPYNEQADQIGLKEFKRPRTDQLIELLRVPMRKN